MESVELVVFKAGQGMILRCIYMEELSLFRQSSLTFAPHRLSMWTYLPVGLLMTIVDAKYRP